MHTDGCEINGSLKQLIKQEEISIKLTLGYWVKRCELAEKYISESPCDPDIYEDQLKAYQEWQEFIKD